MRILTAREKQILRLIVSGQRDKQIAATLYLSRWTVRTHLTSAFKKLGVHNRTHAAIIFGNSRWMAE